MISETDPVTVTLHFLSWQGLSTLLAMLAIAVATALVWLMLNTSERRPPVTIDACFKALAWVLLPVWLWILAATLWGLWLVFNGHGGPLDEGSLGLGALIAAALGAPFVIYGTWLRHKTNRLEQEGHMTDRITKAVEQLGADKIVRRDGVEESVPNIEVRMGAILSLERIAQDSTANDKGRDHVRVMEILCAYIRENSNARKPVDFPLAEWVPLEDDATEEERAAYLRWREARFGEDAGTLARQWAENLPKPRADVQLALTVIGRRSAGQRLVEAAWPDAPTKATVWPFELDFKRLPDEPGDEPLGQAALDTFKAGLNICTAKLRNYRGYRLDLRGANLQGADMAAKQPDGSDAVFSGALLGSARMEGAILWRARMEGADFRQARMEGADFRQARMEGATLWRARMEGVNLRWARMEGAILMEARMEGANLRWARMEGAILWRARMEGADFRQARMEGADFRQARMDSSTPLNAAIFQGAALSDVDYASVRLSAKQVKSCYGDASVILPKRIARPDHWPDWALPRYGDHAFDTEWRKWQADPEGYRPRRNPNDRP